eukprot:1588130-Prymnesium_polylepis.2
MERGSRHVEREAGARTRAAGARRPVCGQAPRYRSLSGCWYRVIFDFEGAYSTWRGGDLLTLRFSFFVNRNMWNSFRYYREDGGGRKNCARKTNI